MVRLNLYPADCNRVDLFHQYGAFTALGSVINKLPQFTSPYLNDILSYVLHPSLHDTVSHKNEAATLVKQILSDMAIAIAPRVLLAPVFAFYDKALLLGAPVWILSMKTL